MSESNQNEKNFNEILNRLQKDISFNVGFFIIIRQYLSNSSAFYLVSIIFRFISIMTLSGNYYKFFKKTSNENSSDIFSIQIFFENISSHKLMSIFNINHKSYIIISFILFFLFLLRISFYFFLLFKLKDLNNDSSKPVPNLYLKIVDHIIYLFFPFILEFLSFAYYIYFIPDKFIIQCDTKVKNISIIILVLNTFLIIGYNINNYIFFICSNKVNSVSYFEVSKENNGSEYDDRPFMFRYPKSVIYIIIALQNMCLLQTIDIYIGGIGKLYYKIIISILLLLAFIVIFCVTMHEYNYNTFINIIISVLTIFCFYSIIIDLLFYLGNYVSKSIQNEIIYVLLKLFIAYLTYLLIFESICLKFLKQKIRQIIFNEKINKKEEEDNIISSFMYLNEIMMNIKVKKNIKSTSLLIKLINDHIKICHKTVCSCKLICNSSSNNEMENNSKDSNKILVDELSEYIKNLLIVMNYLFESIFVDYDYYNNFNLTVLLAEHYCYLKNNPTMSFSFIQTLILKQKKKLNTIQLVTVYELSQKYANYIKVNFDSMNEDKVTKELLNYKQKSEYFNQFLYILKMYNNVKRLLIKYINNEIMILKYKNVFGDSIAFKFDENNENIISIKISFFDLVSKIEDEYNDIKNSTIIKKKNYNRNEIYTSKNKNNLYSVLDLLKKEKNIYRKIINSIKNMEFLKRNMPICLVFKYFLFFDIFEGRKLSTEIIEKLYSSFCNNKTLYSSVISNKVYFLLIKKYIQQNNKFDSKYFVIWKYKKELRTKYFSESCGLRLGYTQKDIINEKIDQLMPKEFAKSHQNMLKQFFIQYQRNYFSTDIGGYIFDSTGTVFYPIKTEGIINYNSFKNLIIIMEFSFKDDIEYRFMLDNNFDLLGHTKNFERDFYLNQSIFQSYNFKVADIFQIKKNLLQKNFEQEYKNILYHKKIRQGKIEEYLVPQFYVPNSEKTHDGFNPANFSGSKHDLYNKIFDNNDFEEIEENEEYVKNNENQKLCKAKKSNQSVYQDLFINNSEIIFHNNMNILLFKSKFVQNLAKELTKIPENDLIFENNKKMYNLIIKSKARINEILMGFLNNNISKDEYLNINLKLSFYYDKYFYFISFIDKENNLKKNHLLKQPSNNLISKISTKINKNDKKNIKPIEKKIINSINSNKQENVTEKSTDINNDNSGIVSFHAAKKNENDLKRNSIKKDSIFTTTSSSKDKELFSADSILNKINTYKKEINRDKFILVIKWIISIICIFIFILYIFTLFMQSKALYIIHKIFLSFFYNLHVNEDLLNIYHDLLSVYFGFMGLNNNSLLTNQDNIYIIQTLPATLKENYHNFTDFYNDFNLEVNNNFEVLFKSRSVYKLKGYWEEVQYNTDYTSEMNLIIYNMYKVSQNINFNNDIYKKDAENFLFQKGIMEKKDSINSYYIKVLYYFVKNYDLLIQIIYLEIYNNILNSCDKYLNRNILLSYFLETIELIFYLIFFVMIFIYLYYSNNILFKNIIFLFLDFSQNDINHNKTADNNRIIYKLLEFKNVLNDFDMNKLRKYVDNISSYKASIYIDNCNDMQNNSYSLNNSSPKLNDINKLNMVNSQDINKKINKKESNSNLNLNFNNKQINSRNVLSNNNYRNILNKDISNMNQSSVEYLSLNKTNNQFLKDKLNSNNTSSSNNFSTNNVIINNRDRNSISQNKNILSSTRTTETIHDIILNKSNKNFIVLIKRYMIITICLLLLIISYNMVKLISTITYYRNYFNYFTDFFIIANRYSMLFYYFNRFRTLIICPDDKINYATQSVSSDYENKSSQFDNLVNNNFKNYANFRYLYELILKDSEKNNNNISYKKEIICQDNTICNKYFDSDYNIFDSGVDFAFKSSMTEISNMYLDYQKSAVNSTEAIMNIIKNNKFTLTDLGMTAVFVNVKERVFSYFNVDERDFVKKFRKNVTAFNLISIVFSLLIFLYVIAIILTVSRYTEPIKDSVYRINCSFYYIKKYEIVNFTGLMRYAKKKSSIC